MAKFGEELNDKDELYRCSVCDEIFDYSDLGHCPRCGHHYVSGDLCGNCHMHTIRKTMRKSGFTHSEWLENLDRRVHDSKS